MRVLAYAFTPGVPPTEIQLWNAGDNPTDYGVHRWTDRSSRDVLAIYEERGNPLQIDVDHNCADLPDDEDGDDAELKRTGGYCRLELRDGAPWLVFDWSAFAVQQIESRERLYLSPEYLVDRETGEITRLVRVSLVGNPGTHHARQLAHAARVGEGDALGSVRATAGGRMDLTMILAALRAALAADDPKVVKESLTALVAEIAKQAGGGAGDAGAAPTEAEGAPEGGAAPEEDDEGAPPVTAGATTPEEKQAAKAKASAPVKAGAKRDLAREFDDFRRDTLLREQGAKLQPAQRVWCSSQPLAVVEGLLGVSATTAATSGGAKAVRASAVRGPQAQVTEEDAEVDAEVDRALGIRASGATTVVHVDGARIFPSLTREQARAMRAGKGA